MLDIKQLIREKINDWQEIENISSEFDVSPVSEQKFGDFSTNIAMVGWKMIPEQVRNDNYPNPRELAEKIVSKLKENDEVNEVFDKIEVAGPGFINFFLSSKYLSDMLHDITQIGEQYGSSNNKSGQKVIVEFGDPNPFKEIHIGHLRNFCIGETFCRLLESQGNEVIRANYQGDVGMHVAKALYGIMKQELGIMNESLSISEKSQMLAQAYAYGATEFEEDETAKQEIIGINRRIYSLVSHSEAEPKNLMGSFADVQDDAMNAQDSPSIDTGQADDNGLKSLWEAGRKVSLDHFEENYARIGVKYDKYYFESVTAVRGKELVLQHIDDGVFERHEGAVVYRGEKDGLHTRVFLTSANYATYEGKDLALAIIKNEEVEHDTSVVLTGNEQLEYFQVMLSALQKIAPEVAQKTEHHTFGHVRLKEGKMSSRTGDVITSSWLLDEAVSRVRVAFPEMDGETSEKVGVGAAKYSMLKFSIPSDIHFSFDESITLEGNSGPYLQYTYVRTKSVLGKAHESSQLSVDNSQLVLSDQLEKEESELLRFLTQYPYVLAQAAEEFAPNILCTYLFEISQKYNHFYQKHKIIGSEKEQFRLNLTQAVGKVLRNGLTILGISTVEKM